MPRLKLTLSARQLAVAAALALIANAASAAPPLEGNTGRFVLAMYKFDCNPPSPTVAEALLDEIEEKTKDSTREQLDEGRRQADAILKDLGRVRFCREVAETLKEPSGVADAQVQATLLGQLADLKTRYAAARGNVLLQESIDKQYKDAACTFFQTYRFVEEWNGSLAEVERSSFTAGDYIHITIQLDDKTTTRSRTEPSSPITDAVAVMAPGTRVRFSGDLYGKCDDFKDEFRIDLDRITQDK